MSAQKPATARSKSAPPAAPAKVQPPAKPAKKEKTEQKEPSIWSVRKHNLQATFQDTMSEMRKITWPDQETTRNLTIVVVGISIFMGVLLGGVDWLLVQILGLF